MFVVNNNVTQTQKSMLMKQNYAVQFDNIPSTSPYPCY